MLQANPRTAPGAHVQGASLIVDGHDFIGRCAHRFRRRCCHGFRARRQDEAAAMQVEHSSVLAVPMAGMYSGEAESVPVRAFGTAASANCDARRAARHRMRLQSVVVNAALRPAGSNPVAFIGVEARRTCRRRPRSRHPTGCHMGQGARMCFNDRDPFDRLLTHMQSRGTASVKPEKHRMTWQPRDTK
jgi:hypothetical protein